MKNLTFLFFLLSLSSRLFSQPMIENGVLIGWKNPPLKLIILDEVTFLFPAPNRRKYKVKVK